MIIGWVFDSTLFTGYSLYSVSARGATLDIFFWFTLSTLSSIGAGVRHSWQSFGLAGGIVQALASVLPRSASLSGYT